MKEETIERVFTRYDWFEAHCDQCCDRTSVINLADERVCYQCLRIDFDEAGDKIVADADLHFGNERFQNAMAGNAALFITVFICSIVTSIAFGFYLASLYARANQ